MTLRPVPASPEEIWKARSVYGKAADGFRPVLIVGLSFVPISLLIYGLQRDWKVMVSAVLLLAFFVIPFWKMIQTFRTRAKRLQRFERIYSISETGLQSSVSFDGGAPERLSAIPWKEFVEVREDGESLILRTKGGETRLPGEAFSNSGQRAQIVALWHAANTAP